jgi:peroxiredoxin
VQAVLRVAALLSLAVIPGLFTGCKTTGASAGNAAAAVGQPAPDFTLHTVGDDRTIQLSGLRGKPVVVNFMCNCAFCYALAHEWVKNQDKIGATEMLAIMHNRQTFNPVAVRHFREATQLKMPILADLNSKTALQYRSTDCPQVWVIDRDGVIRWHSNDRTDPADTIVKGALDSLKSLAKDG